MEQPRDEGGPDLAIKAVNDTFILPYFLEEAQRQDLHVPGGPRKNTCFRERRTLRTSTWNSFGGRVTKPQEWPLAAAVERRRGTSAALPIGQGETLSASAKGPIRHAEWLTASLESAVKSSDSLPLFSHLRTLTSRLFSEGESRKMQAQRISKNSIQKLQKGGLPHVESLGVEELVLLARRLAEENSYLETFISSDARVLQSAALVKAQRECAAALESNRRLQRQVEKDRQVIVELELRSRSFADAYAWLTSHNRMIHAKDAPALVALWRKRVAEAAVTKKVPLAPDFTKDLEDAYAVADSEGDVETAAEDGHEKTTKEDLLMAAELREAEAVSEARQAQARAALAEARAAAAEQQLAATKTQLERLTSAAAASAAAAAVAAAASASPSRPAFSDGAGEGQLKGALRESERRAEAAENECTRMKKVLETLQAALDLATSERQRLEQELAEAVTAAEAKLTAQAEQHAAELAEMEAQHSQTLESMRSSVHETAKLRQELDESRQQCADLSAQLLAAKEAATGDGVRKVASPGGLASPPASDISTLTSERDSYKATALKLEMDIKRLSARAAEATQLEKAVATLKEKLHASEELKTAYEALQKEAQTLRDQMSARQSPPVSPEGPEAQDKQTDSTAMAQEREGLRKEVAALQEELTKLRGEAESLQTQGKGPKKPSVKGPDDTSSEETTLTATEVAELVKERQALQEKVRALEEELAALRASARSPTKALPASKSIPSLTSAPQASQPSPSKKPPAPASKLGKTAAVLSTTDHPETLPGDDGARSASTVTAEPAVAEAKRRPLPPKVAKAVAETPPAGAVVPAADAGAKASLSMKGGPPVNKKLPASLQPKAVKAPSPEGPGSFAKVKAEPAFTKRSEAPLASSALAVDAKTPSDDPGVSNGNEAAPPLSTATAPAGVAVARSTADSKEGAEKAETTVPKALAKGTKVPAPPKKAPPVESPLLAEGVFSMEAKQKLEKEVTDLKEQLAAREELQKAYEALQKENESLQAKLNAVKSPEKSTGLRPAGDKPVGKAHTAVSDPHGNFEAVAKERDMLAEKVKGLEQELAVLRDSQKAATLDKVAADKQLVQGPKALPVCKARPENPAVPLAKGPAEEASASAGEVAAAQLRAELDNAKQEVATLRQQLADEQKSKDNYAALAEEAKKLKSEYEAFKMKSEGRTGSSVKGPDDTSSEETTLTAMEVAELVKERQALQEKVRALEEELAALRASARSPTKAPPASKSIPSLTSAPQASQPSPSKKPPAPASKVGKTAAVLSTTDHPETLPGDDGARSASTVTAEPAVAEAKRRPLPPKVAKAVAETPPAGAVVPAADAGAKASLSMKGGPPVNKKLPASLQPKAVKAPSPEGPGSFAKVKAEPAFTKRSEAPLASSALAVDAKTPSDDPGVSNGNEAAPPLSTATAPAGVAVARSTADSKEGAEKAETTVPKALAKGTKVPAPPKKAPPVESPLLAEGVFSMEAKQKLEKEVTDLKEQLAAREELQKAYEALQKENESLQAKLNAVKSPEKSTGLRPAGDKPVGKTQTAVSEANQPNAPAELQADVEVLKAKAAAAEALEKDIRRLQEQLRASEELRAAHEALEKETEALKEQLRELQSKAGQQKDLEETKSAGKGQLLTASEIEAVLQERNELRERVRDLEKEVAAAAGSAAQPSAMPLTTKKAVEQKGPGKSLPSDSKPPPPLPRRGQASSAKPAAVALPAGEEAGKPSPEETGEVVSKVGGVLSPAAKIANGEQEPGATKTFVGGKGPPPKKLESSLGKKPLPPKAGKELLLSKKAEGSEGPAEPLRKSTKKAPPPPPKPAENDTKVPPPPKKAPPVVSTSGDRVELNGESASNLEQEIASLRERLAAAEGLKKTHESLQKEFEALQEELKALKTQAKASGTEEKAQTSEAEILEPQETEQLRKERNTLRERVAALEAELSTLRAAGAQVVTIPKTKGSLPSKVKPGKPPLPAKVPTQAISTAKDVLISGAAGDGKDEGPVISAGAEAAKEETHHEAKLGSPSMKGVALEGRLNKESLLTEEVLSKSDAETEEGDSEGESSPAEERVAELTERLYRAKRRVRNLVIKCNALVEMEKEREALRNQLESLKAKHEANIKLHEKEAKDKPAMTVVDKAEDSATMLKPASAVTLPSSAVASTVADDLEGMSTMKTGLTTQSSSALLDVRPPADWAAKYEKLKAQRDKVYQAYKAQKERITSLEEEEAITKERLEKLERLYRDTKEELDIATRPPQQVEETESTGILSWLGGGAHEAKNPEEQKLRARVELLQQRLQKALAENDALSSKLAQLRTTPTGSPRGEASVGDEATTRGPQRRASEHLLPDAAVKEAGHASFAKAPPTTPPGPVSGEGTEGNSLAELQEQIKQKDAQIKEYKAEILELKASAAPVSDAASVAAELAKKQEELQTKASELEKVTEEALKKETLIREKTKEIESLKARLESLEKEKLQVLSDNSALKKELERVQKELEALKAETSGPPPTKEKPKPQPSGGANSSPGKAVQRAPSIAKRMPGLPPPPASKVDRPGTAAVSAGATREEQQAADQKPTKTAVAGPTGDQLKKPSQHLKGRDENDEDPSHSEASGTETVSKKKLKKKTAESDGDSKPSKSPEEDDGGAKKKKKKKKKGETSEERSAQHSEVENAAEAVGETTATADAPTGWGFGLFGNNQGTNDASKGDTAAKDASSSAPRPSLLGMIVGGDRAEETPKENEVPPLKLSTVEGAEDQSDDSSSDDGETDGGIASTIAGFFWGI